MSPVFPVFDRGEPPEEGLEDKGQGSQEDHKGEPYKTNQQDQDQDPEGKARSSWEKLSSEEKLKKKKVWEHRKTTLEYFEIPPGSTPPRNSEQDVYLDSDYGEEDQEVLDDLEHEEKEDQAAQGDLETKPMPKEDRMTVQMGSPLSIAKHLELANIVSRSDEILAYTRTPIIGPETTLKIITWKRSDGTTEKITTDFAHKDEKDIYSKQITKPYKVTYNKEKDRWEKETAAKTTQTSTKEKKTHTLEEEAQECIKRIAGKIKNLKRQHIQKINEKEKTKQYKDNTHTIANDLMFQRHLEDIRKREEVLEERYQFICPEPLCMWGKKEKEQTENDEPCQKCEFQMTGARVGEIQMTGEGRTPHRYPTEVEGQKNSEKANDRQARGYPNRKTEYAEAGKDLKEFELLIRRAKTILDTERFVRRMDEASSKRQQKKIEKIIKKRQAKLTEAYDREELLKEERVRTNKEKRRREGKPKKTKNTNNLSTSSGTEIDVKFVHQKRKRR